MDPIKGGTDSGSDTASAPDHLPHSGRSAALAVPYSTRRTLSVRTRFEIFKRDDFTCRYCGRKSPEVVLEVDHIVPVREGGDDDPVNLATSCWECNSGKAGVSLDRVMTGEDPHDRAIEALERERQLREYNAAMATINQRREADFCDLRDWWCEEIGSDHIGYNDVAWLKGAVLSTAAEDIRYAMAVAISRGHIKDFRYVGGILRSQREQRRSEGEDA
jgi:hypothetical protein